MGERSARRPHTPDFARHYGVLHRLLFCLEKRKRASAAKTISMPDRSGGEDRRETISEIHRRCIQESSRRSEG